MTIGNHIKTTQLRHPWTTNGIPVATSVSTIKNGKSWNGDDDPMWRAKIASGRPAVNRFDSIKYVEEKAPFVYDVFHYGDWRGRGLYPLSGIDLETGWGSLTVPSLNPKMSMLCLAEIRKVRDKFQGFVILGELRETIRMLRSPFKAITKRMVRFQDKMKQPLSAYRRMRRDSTSPERVTRERKKLKDDIINSYLEFAFGLSPLIGDVEDIAKVAGNLNQLGDIKRIFKNDDDSRSDVISETQPGEVIFLKCSYRRKVFLYQQYAIGVRRAGADPVLAKRLAYAGGFQLDDLIPAAWELVPWSFLVDYVTNIGDIINAMTVDTSDVLWSARTVVEERRLNLVSFEVLNKPKPSEFNFYSAPSYSGSKTYVYRRSVLPNVGFKDFTDVFSLSLPGPGQALSGGLALYQSFFSRR